MNIRIVAVWEVGTTQCHEKCGQCKVELSDAILSNFIWPAAMVFIHEATHFVGSVI